MLVMGSPGPPPLYETGSRLDMISWPLECLASAGNPLASGADRETNQGPPKIDVTLAGKSSPQQQSNGILCVCRGVAVSREYEIPPS